MKIEGLDKLVKTLDNSSKKFNSEASKSLDNVSSKLLRKVKLKTPVDTGVLRTSWQHKKVSELARVVYNNKHYAPHVEYGHRTRGGKSFVDGQYMLGKSVKEIEDDLDREFSIMIENLWKE